MSTYTEAKRQAYLRNKEKIAAAEKEKKRWLTYHAEHKEEVSVRRKQRRLKKELPPIDEEKVRRYYELMEEAKTLQSEVTRKKKREAALANRAKRSGAIIPAIIPEAPEGEITLEILEIPGLSE
jgi:hypothetical protein